MQNDIICQLKGCLFQVFIENNIYNNSLLRKSPNNLHWYYFELFCISDHTLSKSKDHFDTVEHLIHSPEDHREWDREEDKTDREDNMENIK